MPSNPPDPGSQKPEPLYDYLRRRLLAQRERLSVAAIEHTAHDLPGGDLLWQAVHDTEEALRKSYPRLWERHQDEWVTTDAARLHSVENPAPDVCRICRERSGPVEEMRPAS
ncbi:hypothetical protein ACI792_13010 [Blastococcus sp. SYSU DS0669]